MADTSQRNPDEIEKEIREVRARMLQTLDALESRLDPQRLKREATDAVRERTVGRVENFAEDATSMVKGAGNDVFETIKDNPVPAALVAIGLGWLFMERRNENRPQMYRGTRPPYPQYDYGQGTGYRSSTQGTAERLSDRAQDMGGQVQDKAQDLKYAAQDKAQQVQDKAQDLKYAAQDKAEDFKDAAQDKAQQLAGQADELRSTAQESVQRVGTRFEAMLNENPLLVGAVALGIGAAIGMSLPSTTQEDHLLGERRDQLMDKAQSAASDTMDKVQTVAQRAGEAAKDAAQDEAQKQNLSVGANS